MNAAPNVAPPRWFIGGWAFGPRALAQLLSEADRPCPARCWTADEWAHGGAAALDDPAQPPVELVGWSLGALHALAAARWRPARIARLTLWAGTARFTATDGYACGVPESELRALGRALRRAPETTLTAFFRRAAAPEALSDETASAWVREALAAGLPPLLDGLERLRALDLRAEVVGLTMPVALCHGAADAVIPAAAGVWLHDRLPGARLTLLPHAGHIGVLR